MTLQTKLASTFAFMTFCEVIPSKSVPDFDQTNFANVRIRKDIVYIDISTFY